MFGVRLIVCLLITVLIGNFCLSSSVMAGKVLQIGGSSTVNNFVFFEREKEIQQKTSVPFKVNVTSSGRGLLALSKDQVDIGMISSELSVLIQKLNAQGHSLKEEDYIVYKISESRALFGVHADNPIQSLNKQQIQDLLLGNIKTWDELGVKGVGPVIVVTEHPTGGVYNTVVAKVLNGKDVTKNRITMQNGPQVGLVISQNIGGFGMISDATPRDQLINSRFVSTPDVNAVQELYFVVRKNETNRSVFKFINGIVQ